MISKLLQCAAVCCNLLQCVAVCWAVDTICYLICIWLSTPTICVWVWICVVCVRICVVCVWTGSVCVCGHVVCVCGHRHKVRVCGCVCVDIEQDACVWMGVCGYRTRQVT